MYARGSRYRDVPSSVHRTARGELVTSTDVRPPAPRDASFRHTVLQRDRLDLLAFRYYRSPTRWWQIADANPEWSFPLDLLDRSPLVDEELAVVHPGLERALDDLARGLGAAGTLCASGGDVFSSTVALSLAPAGGRAAVLGAIAAAGFALVRSFEWTQDGVAQEAFTFEAPGAKEDWRAGLDALVATPGVVRAVPLAPAERVSVTYNEAMVTREGLAGVLASHGFALVLRESRRLERVGSRIAIPPDLAR